MKNSGYLGANLEVLEGRLPELADLIRQAARDGVADGQSDCPHLEAFVSPKGEVSAKLGGLLLHSAYDPAGEARRLAASLPPAADTALLLGFGLGYLPEAILASVSTVDRVLVCAADPRTLAACLDLRDLTRLLSDERLGFLVGGPPEALIAALDEVGTRRLGILGLRAEEAAFPGWYGALRAAAERFAAKETINENTLRRFGRLWVRNLARNLPLIGELPGTSRLESRFRGLPALVLAAGPSLDDVLPLLPALRERLLLICVDTALRSVLRAGVEPDFLVVVDPQYWNWRHLEGLSSPSSILVSESAAFPAVFRFGCRATFLCSSLFPLGKAIELAAGEKGKLGAGGSVATTAWDLARVLGASPIYMAGLDLAFPRGETHARASLFEQRALSGGLRLAPAETNQAAALFSGGASWAPGNDGEPVRTDKRMSLYAWWFESRLAAPEAPRTYGLSAHGLAIPGLSLERLAELLRLPPRRYELDGILSAIAAIKEDKAAAQGAEAGFTALMRELSSAKDAAELAITEAATARADLAIGRDARARLALLDSLDAKLLSGGAGDVIGFLLPPLSEILGKPARNLADSLLCSEELYARVADSARFHLEILEKHRL
jgi:hypothetical protein